MPQQVIDLIEFVLAIVLELLPVELIDRLVKAGQDVEPLRLNARPDDAAILLFPVPENQALLFQPVQEAGHVGNLRDHPLADLVAGKAALSRAAQDSQGVVLRGRQIFLLQELPQIVLETVSRADNAEEDLFLQTAERLGLLEFGLEIGGHGWGSNRCFSYLRYNRDCQPGFGPAACIEQFRLVKYRDIAPKKGSNCGCKGMFLSLTTLRGS
jgi:hypothetical protein